LHVAKVVFRVILVWVVGQELTRVRDGIDRYIAIGCRIILDSVDCEKERGQARGESGVKKGSEAMITCQWIFHE
jgi:hypothetical protein